MEQLHLPAFRQARGAMTLPGSKSISNRTLLLAALAHGETEILDLLESDDTARMLEALAKSGIAVKQVSDKAWKVTGCGGKLPVKEAEYFLGNAGTAFRPLTAALAFSGGHYRLSGVPRMHERPIGDLVDALRQVGAQISYLANEGFPPLEIFPAEIDVSRVIQIRGEVSSQFLTALLMALPLAGRTATIEVVGELISKPYIEITLNLMERFGVKVVREGWQRFVISEGARYLSPTTIPVEGDASSASYFIAAGILGGDVTIHGIGRNSIQGDIQFAEAAGRMGGDIVYGENKLRAIKTGPIRAIDMDCNLIPDAAMTLAVMALFAEGTTTLRNIASWRVKETDRLFAMATELRKVGARVTEGPDYLSITPPEQLILGAEIDTYDDHRIAMCFSLVSLAGVPITINDPGCVAKTFPEYFSVFQEIVVV